MFGRTGCDKYAIDLPRDSIIEYQARTSNVRKLGFNLNQVIIASGLRVTANDFRHGKMKSLGFDVAVGQPQFAQEFGSALFEPAQIVGVIDHAHLVGVAINHPVRSDVFHMTNDRPSVIPIVFLRDSQSIDSTRLRRCFRFCY